MLGIVDVGGGMRCIYSAGVYDCFYDRKIDVGYCLGVSAGSANLISYVCGQRGRNLEFYSNYALRKEYMSVRNFVKTGSYIGLDYIFSTLCNTDGEYPLDFEHFKESGIIYRAAATRASDGKSIFFENKDVKENCYDILKASCALPVACKPYPIEGELFFDGGIAEPIPIRKAFDDGCDKVILVLTKPREQYTIPIGKKKLVHTILSRYPAVAGLMDNLHLRSEQVLSEAKMLEKEGRLVVVEPRDCFGMKTLTRDKITLCKMYRQGYEDAGRLIDNGTI